MFLHPLIHAFSSGFCSSELNGEFEAMGRDINMRVWNFECCCKQHFKAISYARQDTDDRLDATVIYKEHALLSYLATKPSLSISLLPREHILSRCNYTSCPSPPHTSSHLLQHPQQHPSSKHAVISPTHNRPRIPTITRNKHNSNQQAQQLLIC